MIPQVPPIRGTPSVLPSWNCHAGCPRFEATSIERFPQSKSIAHGLEAVASSKHEPQSKKIGFEFTDAANAVQRLLVAEMDLSKSEGLAKLAKDASVQKVSEGEAMEGIVLAIESGASRGLRTLGLVVDCQKKTQIAELQLGRALTETEEKQIRYNGVMSEGAKIEDAHIQTLRRPLARAAHPAGPGSLGSAQK